MMTSQTVSVPCADGLGIRLRMLDGWGPDLLICHATGFHGAAYLPMAHRLTEAFRVWLLDFRGHGASDPSPSGDYSWGHMAQDVLACIEVIKSSAPDRHRAGSDLPHTPRGDSGSGAADEHPIYGFGHSMGGAALLLAEEQAPETFAGLFLYEPIVMPEGHFARRGDNPLAAGARRRREVFESRDEALARYASRPPLNVLHAEALAAYVRDGFVDLPEGGVRLACRAETEARTFEGSHAMTVERVGAVGVEAVVAAGGLGGAPNPAEFAPHVASTMPGARLLEYPALGHFGPLEAPGIVAADVEAELLDQRR